MRFQCFLLGSLACLQLAELGICTWVFQVHQKTVQDLLRSWVHFQRIPRDHWNKPEKKQMSEPRNKNSVHPALAGAKGRRPLQYNLPLTRNLPASSHFCYQIPWVDNFDLQSQGWQARLCRCSKQQAHTINLGEKHMVQSYETKDPLHRQNLRPAPALVHHQVLREQHRGSCYNSGSDTLPNQIESIELNDGGNVNPACRKKCHYTTGLTTPPGHRQGPN